MPFEVDNLLNETPQTIKVIGVGGGGGNAVNHCQRRRAQRGADLHEHR